MYYIMSNEGIEFTCNTFEEAEDWWLKYGDDDMWITSDEDESCCLEQDESKELDYAYQEC